MPRFRSKIPFIFSEIEPSTERHAGFTPDCEEKGFQIVFAMLREKFIHPGILAEYQGR